MEGDALDEVRATLAFESGLIVELFASRVDTERRRELRVMTAEETRTIPLDARSAGGDRPLEDPLTAQWADFMGAVTERRPSVNDGTAGVAALRWVAAVQAAAAGSIAPAPDPSSSERSSGVGV